MEQPDTLAFLEAQNRVLMELVTAELNARIFWEATAKALMAPKPEPETAP